MGGYGAIRLGLKYPDRFASIFGHSSFLPNAEEWAAWSADWGWWSASFRAALRAEGNAYDWAARLDPLHAPRQVAALLCNQRSRIAAAAWLRDQAPAVQSWFAPEGPRRYGFVPVRRDRREATTVHRRCGRAEVRHLIASAEVAGVLDWPYLGQGLLLIRGWEHQGQVGPEIHWEHSPGGPRVRLDGYCPCPNE